MNRTFKAVLFVIVCHTMSLISFPAFASKSIELEDTYYAATDEWIFAASVGYGKMYNPLNKQEDISLYVLPDIRYYSENFSVENLDLAYSLYQRKHLVIDLIGQPNLDGIYFPGKGHKFVATLAGIPGFGQLEGEDEELPLPVPDKRNLSYMAGAELRYYGEIDFSLSATTDVTNVHHGQEYRAIVHKAWMLENFVFELEAGATYKSSSLTDYYYGLELQQGLYEITTYTPSAAINYHFRADLTYLYNEHWFLISAFRNEWLDSEITNSLIVVKDKMPSFFVGIKHVF